MLPKNSYKMAAFAMFQGLGMYLYDYASALQMLVTRLFLVVVSWPTNISYDVLLSYEKLLNPKWL